MLKRHKLNERNTSQIRKIHNNLHSHNLYPNKWMLEYQRLNGTQVRFLTIVPIKKGL